MRMYLIAFFTLFLELNGFSQKADTVSKGNEIVGYYRNDSLLYRGSLSTGGRRILTGDSAKKVENKMKGFWISPNRSSSHRDSLYFGDDGIFYGARYHSSDTVAKSGYKHDVGRWWITITASGELFLEVSCASIEQQGNFARYTSKLTFSNHFFFMGEEWRRLE
jgi:hypothetical protein